MRGMFGQAVYLPILLTLAGSHGPTVSRGRAAVRNRLMVGSSIRVGSALRALRRSPGRNIASILLHMKGRARSTNVSSGSPKRIMPAETMLVREEMGKGDFDSPESLARFLELNGLDLSVWGKVALMCDVGTCIPF
eukprot:630020-Amorphochlora_amoeboformis.AAC.3